MNYTMLILNLVIIQKFKFTLNFLEDQDCPISWGGRDKEFYNT